MKRIRQPMDSAPSFLNIKPIRARVLSFLLILMVSVTVPNVSATIQSEPLGVRAVVIQSACGVGLEQDIEVMFTFSANDTDQDLGDFQYNVTVDGVDQGDVTGKDDYEEGGGRGIFKITFIGSCASYDIDVHVWDSPHEGDSSCQVTVDTSELGSADSCGDLITDFSREVYCAPAYPSEEIGFHWTQGVTIQSSGAELGFTETFLNPAFAALNLPGDGASYQFTTDIRASSDGGSSKDYFFFGTKDFEVGASSAGNGLDTGSFANGISFQLTESGSSWDMAIKHHDDGVRYSIALDTFNSDPTPGVGNSPTLTVTIDQWTGLATMTLASESFTASLNATIGEHLGNFHSFWIEHRAGTSYMVRDGTSLCLYSALESQGGGSGEIGEPSQSLENFDGQGGFGGDPEFPGIDVQSTANSLGIESLYMGYILGGILVMAVSIIGYLTAKGIGAGAGAALAVIGTTILNLTPAWLLVLILLLSVTIVVLNVKGGSE